MRGAQPAELAERGKQRLIKPGIAQVSLELHPGGAQHHGASRRGRIGRRVQQRCLPGARLTQEQERPATRGRLLDKFRENREFPLPPDKLRGPICHEGHLAFLGGLGPPFRVIMLAP